MSRQTVTETVPFEYEQVTCDVCQQVVQKGWPHADCAVCGRDVCRQCMEWRVILCLSAWSEPQPLCTRCLVDYEEFNGQVVFLTAQYEEAVDRVLADWRQRSLSKPEDDR